MPKRAGHLYERMMDKDLIRETIISGSKGKRKRHDVRKVLADVDGYTEKIYALIASGCYTPTKPKQIKIKDRSSGKDRTISVVPYYPDGIMHQLIVAAAKDVFWRGMYHWSCASIPGRGNMHAIKYIKRALKKDRRGTKYCAKMDIRHYYPSVRPDVMMRALRRKIKDRRFLDLIESIIRSNPDGGLAIGFYLDQWLANFLLEPLDHHVCGLDGVRYYVRNMDDLVLLGPNKRKLRRAIAVISGFLTHMGLELKRNWQVFPVDSRGVDFVGYKFFHGHTLLRKRNLLKLIRQSRKVRKRTEARKPVPFRAAAGLLSRAGQLKHCSGQGIHKRWIGPIGTRRLKNIIRRHSREMAA